MAIKYFFEDDQVLERVFVMYGNTTDFYMTLTNGWHFIEPLLESHLKYMGYKVVLFYYGGKLLRCYDQELAENRRRYFPTPAEKRRSSETVEERSGNDTEKATATTVVNAPTGAGKAKKKPPRIGIGGSPVKKEKAEAGGDREKAPLSFEYQEDDIPEYLDGIMQSNEVKCAVVFGNAGSFMNERSSRIAAYISGWYAIKGNNPNISILLFRERYLEALPKMLEASPSWRFLYENVFSKSASGKNLIRIGAPYEDEVYYLLSVYIREMGDTRALAELKVTQQDVVSAAQRLLRESEDRRLVHLRNYVINHKDNALKMLLEEYGPQKEVDALAYLHEKEGWESIAEVLDRIVDGALVGHSGTSKQQFPLDTRRNLRMSYGMSGQAYDLNLSMVLVGNPGTGKTTAAKWIGETMRQKGLLSSGHLIKVTRADLVAGYVGQTAQLTKARLADARGGILFVDEAYSLYRRGVGGENNDFGIEAIETILEAMTSMRGEICVIFAGYPKEMNALLNEANSGLMRRFEGNIIHIPDYPPRLLESILLKRISDKNREHADNGRMLTFMLDGWLASSDDVKRASMLPDQLLSVTRSARDEEKPLPALSVFIDNWYADRVESRFGNAGAAVELAEMMMGNALKRTNSFLHEVIIKSEDFAEGREKLFECRKPTVEQVEAQMREVVGMQEVKDLLKRVTRYLEMCRIQQDMAKKLKGSIASPKGIRAGNYLFVGNPGVGKTMIARKLALTLSTLGIIRRYEPIRVTGLDLINRLQRDGIGGLKKYVEDCKGAVLMVDEAHQLSTYEGAGGMVIKALLDPMIEWNDQMCFVFCCYPEEQARLEATEQGFSRRIDEVFRFSDYTPEEVLQIFELMLKREDYRADEGGMAIALERLKEMRQAGLPWENGAIAEKLLHESRISMSMRMLENKGRHQLTSELSEGTLEESELYHLTAQDIAAGFERMIINLSRKTV